MRGRTAAISGRHSAVSNRPETTEMLRGAQHDRRGETAERRAAVGRKRQGLRPGILRGRVFGLRLQSARREPRPPTKASDALRMTREGAALPDFESGLFEREVGAARPRCPAASAGPRIDSVVQLGKLQNRSRMASHQVPSAQPIGRCQITSNAQEYRIFLKHREATRGNKTQNSCHPSDTDLGSIAPFWNLASSNPSADSAWRVTVTLPAKSAKLATAFQA